MFQLMRPFSSRSTLVLVLFIMAIVFLVFGIIGFIGEAVSIIQFGRQRDLFTMIHRICSALVYMLEPAFLTFGLAVVAGYLADVRDELVRDRSNDPHEGDSTQD